MRFMISLSVAAFGSVAIALASPAAGQGASVVIAGSELAAPPAFWPDAFWGVTSTIQRAFPFSIIDDGPFRLDELQVAAFNYSNLPGASAQFSIHSDLAGLPGQVVTTFAVNGISTTPTVLSAVPATAAILESQTPYWIVGSTTRGQVNWNMGDSVFGRSAYRVRGEDWVVNQFSNLSAFALLGTRVPEPSTAGLFASAAILLATVRKRSL